MDHNQQQSSASWSPLDFARHSHDYPSPASPSYPLTYAQQHDFHDPSSSSSSSADPQFSQIHSSIGPDRVLTRRQRAAIASQQQQQNGAPHRRFSQSSPHDSRQATGMYYGMMLPESSRPQTPNTQSNSLDLHDAAVPQSAATPSVPFPERETLTLSIGSAAGMSSSMRSPQFPLTPASTSSSASSSGFDARTSSQLFPAQHSRSNSSSASTNPRSASPALSVASALTSVSSSASGPTSTSGLRLLKDGSTLGSPIAALANSGLPQTFPSLPPARTKQRKQRLFNVDRKAICQYHKDHPNARQEDIAVRYGVERSTISKILKNKSKWLNMDDGTNPKVAKHRPSKFPTIEIKLRNWLEQATTSNQSLSDAMIRSKAKEFAHEVGYDDEKFKASSGWIENFKHRNNIKGGKWLNFGKTPFGMAYLLRQASPLHDDVDDDDDEHFEDDRDHMHNHSGLHLDDRHTPGPSGAPMHHHGMPSLSLQPAWPTPMAHPSHSQHSDVAELTDHYSSQGHHHHLDQHHQEPHASHSHSQPHDDISMHPPTIDPQLDPPAVAIPVLIQDAPGMYIETHSGQQIYHSEGPRLPRAPTQPTLADAEEAMTTVITFLDTIGKGIVKPEDRNALFNVKVALFQAGSGVDFQGGSR